MSDDTDYKAINEQLIAENEKLREQVAKFKLAAFDMNMIYNTIVRALKNPIFWLGYFTAILVTLLFELFRRD